jgi:hypothetical protein
LIRGGRESDRGGVNDFMPGAPEKPHPLNSMTSSSARLAA